jgi:glucose/arabinose dehydrogenase
MRKQSVAFLLFMTLMLVGCGETARLPVSAGIGPNPTLPPPTKTLIPTVKIAPAKGWPPGIKPAVAPGLSVTAFASNLDHPRWLYVLPDGAVLVAETNAPADREQKKGLRAWFMKRVMKRAGAAVPSANRITLLHDTNGDGVADTRTAFLERLNSPFGMALVGNNFYVANADALMRFPYREGRISGAGTRITEFEGSRINHHWTKSLVANRDGSKLYVGAGSNSNVAERGMVNEVERAAILEIDPATGRKRVFASGLRNPVGMSWNPQTGVLWTSVNERDEIGSDLVPDYITSVRDGGFYGWPYSYYGQTVDTRVRPPRPDLVASAIKPDYALGPHTGSLGLTFYDSTLLSQFRNGAIVGQHGSWNRNPRSGYKVIYIPFTDGQPSGPPQDVLTGFLDSEGNAYGRPVGVAVDREGALLVADDVGNVVWRITPAR